MTNRDHLTLQNDSSPTKPLGSYYGHLGNGRSSKFICNDPDCQKVFRFKSEVERHILTHIEVGIYRCSFEGCDKSFKRMPSLKSHIRSQHTGETPLTCSHEGCARSFSTEAKLKYHILQHLGMRPYLCSFAGCEKSFLTASQLKKHENSTSIHAHQQMTPFNRDNGTVHTQSPLESEGGIYKKIKPEVEVQDSGNLLRYSIKFSSLCFPSVTHGLESRGGYEEGNIISTKIPTKAVDLKLNPTNFEGLISSPDVETMAVSSLEKESSLSNSDVGTDYTWKESDPQGLLGCPENFDIDKFLFGNDLMMDQELADYRRAHDLFL